jgi:magnesium transporter
VQEAFGLHDLAIEDAHLAHQRPKLEIYGKSLFVVLRTVRINEENQNLEFGETHVFVGPRFVVSVRHGSLKSHVGLRAHCEATPHLLARGPAFVLHALMDFIVSQYFPIVEGLEGELGALEREIFGGHFSRDATGRIYRLKRDLLAVRQAVLPLIDISSQLMRRESELIPAEDRLYFQDVNDHVLRLADMVDSLQELSTTALEANLSLISVSQNDDTKKLAAWAAILAVPTMIAGLYGMNFSYMPELHWQLGYPVVLGSMGAICLILHRAFKRSGWL